MEYRRTPVTTKEIIQYSKLRISRLKEELKKEKLSDKQKMIISKRMAELNKLIGVINKDSIKKEISKMKHHIYSKKDKK